MPSSIKVHDLNFELFIDALSIQEKVENIGAAINKDYKTKRPLFLGILNGCFVFAADLMRRINIDCEIEFVKLASYEGLTSSGKLTEMIGLDDEKVQDRHIIIIEDIIDTGNTLAQFLPVLKATNPASITLAALLVKPDALQHPLKINYCGMEIPDKFVIGYGLDYNGLGRNLKEIYQVSV